MDDLEKLIRAQDGLIARRQVLAAGESRHDISRRLRRREWATVHEGVYVNHTGALTWQQRAWAAVLWAWPAALSHDSALRALDGPGKKGRDDGLIHVAIAAERRAVAPTGIVVHRMSHFADRVQWNKHPPRIRFDQAVIDSAADATTDQDAIAVLADAVNGRRTTADRLIVALADRARIPRRSWLSGILADVEAGTCSVLEHGYLARIERAHGLPQGQRQVPASNGTRPMFRDVEYADHGVIVELDGRLGHTSVEDRERDLDRDLAAAGEGKQTLRISYGQVFDRACATAARIAQVLGREVRPCAECGRSDPPGEPDLPISA